MTAAPLVRCAQIVDGDQYAVQLTLDPDAVIVALAKALRGNHEKLMLVRVLAADKPARMSAHADLLRILADVFTVTLSPGEATLLMDDIYDAAIEPPWCQHCETYSVTTVDGVELCHQHARAKDLVESEAM